MNHPFVPLSLASVVALFLVASGCGTGDSEPEPVPDIAGAYVLSFLLVDNACTPPDFSFGFWDIFAFAENNGNDLPVLQADFTQSGTLLSAHLPVPDCTLEGDVGVGGVFFLYGDCDDDTMDRELRLNGTAEPYGSGWTVSGSLIVDVDVAGVDGGAGDGETDCSVESTATGTGTAIGG